MDIRNRTLIEFLASAIDFLTCMYIDITREAHTRISRKNIQSIGRTETTDKRERIVNFRLTE
jgi:hypothetical protein